MELTEEEIVEKIRNLIEDECGFNIQSEYFILKKAIEEVWEDIKEDGDDEEIGDDLDEGENGEYDKTDKEEEDDILEATPTVEGEYPDEEDKKSAKNK